MRNLPKAAAAAALLCCLALLFSGCQMLYIAYPETEGEPRETQTAQTRDISDPPTAETGMGFRFSDVPSRFPEAEEAASALYPADFSGSVFMTVLAKEASNTLEAAESDPEYQELAKRNALISDTYKIAFVFRTQPLQTIRETLAASVKAGTGTAAYYADALEIPAKGAAAFAVSGLLLNLRQLPFYEVAFSGNAGAGTIGGKSFFDVSAATERYCDTCVLYFNRGAAGAEVTKKLYGAALSGAFTFEVLLSAAQEAKSPAATDFGGDFALSLLADTVVARSGLRYTVPDAGGIPQLSATDGHAGELTSLLSRLSALRVRFAAPQMAAETDSSATAAADPTAREIFARGDMLFYMGRLCEIPDLAPSPAAWGLLPLPSEKDAPLTEPNRSVLCVTGNNARLEQTALILTALGAVSGDWMRSDYAMRIAEGNLRDNESFFTLRLAVSGRSFCDFADLYADSCADLTAATKEAAEKCLAEGIPVGSSALPLIDKVNKAIRSLS